MRFSSIMEDAMMTSRCNMVRFCSQKRAMASMACMICSADIHATYEACLKPRPYFVRQRTSLSSALTFSSIRTNTLLPSSPSTSSAGAAAQEAVRAFVNAADCSSTLAALLPSSALLLTALVHNLREEKTELVVTTTT